MNDNDTKQERTTAYQRATNRYYKALEANLRDELGRQGLAAASMPGGVQISVEGVGVGVGGNPKKSGNLIDGI